MKNNNLKDDILVWKFTELICRLEMCGSEESSEYWKSELIKLIEKVEEQMKQDLPKSEYEYLDS